MNKSSRKITAVFAILTIIGSIPYWILTAIGSMAGPLPDYAISVLLFIPIFLHSLLISKNTIIEKARCTLFYVVVVFVLCLMRYSEQAHAPGYGEWFGNTCLISFLICSGFFVIGFLVFARRSIPAGDSPIPISIKISVTLWILILLGMSSYLYAFSKISVLAISTGSYTARSESSFVVFYEGALSPRWRIKFLGGGSGDPQDVAEIHASLTGQIVLARGRNITHY